MLQIFEPITNGAVNSQHQFLNWQKSSTFWYQQHHAYMWAAAPAVIPLLPKIFHLVFPFTSAPQLKPHLSLLWQGNQFGPDNMLHTDPARGRPVPCFILYSPLINLAGPTGGYRIDLGICIAQAFLFPAWKWFFFLEVFTVWDLLLQI